jgi:hypothetical protein
MKIRDELPLPEGKKLFIDNHEYHTGNRINFYVVDNDVPALDDDGELTVCALTATCWYAEKKYHDVDPDHHKKKKNERDLDELDDWRIYVKIMKTFWKLKQTFRLGEDSAYAWKGQIHRKMMNELRREF